MGVTVAMLNAKGGVGKTTLVANLGAALAEKDYRVLMVDVDPQASLTVVCGMLDRAIEENKHLWAVMAQWLQGDTASVRDVILQPPAYCGADLLAATDALHAADMQLVSAIGRETLLRRILTSISADYDYILLDSRPAVGVLPINVVVASDFIVIPMMAEPMAKTGFSLVARFLRQVMTTQLNPQLRLMGLVISQYEAGRTHSRKVMAELEEGAGGAGVQIFKTKIPNRVAFIHASSKQQPVITFRAKNSDGAESIRALAQEFIQQVTELTEEL